MAVIFLAGLLWLGGESQARAAECLSEKRVDTYRCIDKPIVGCVFERTGGTSLTSCYQPDSNTCVSTTGICSSNDSCDSNCNCSNSPITCWSDGGSDGGGGCPAGYSMVHECRNSPCANGWTGSDNCSPECPPENNNGVPQSCCKKCVANPTCDATAPTGLSVQYQSDLPNLPNRSAKLTWTVEIMQKACSRIWGRLSSGSHKSGLRRHGLGILRKQGGEVGPFQARDQFLLGFAPDRFERAIGIEEA